MPRVDSRQCLWSRDEPSCTIKTLHTGNWSSTRDINASYIVCALAISGYMMMSGDTDNVNYHQM